MYSILFSIRILHGKVLKKLDDLKHNVKMNENMKLYKISLMQSLLNPIQNTIQYIEHTLNQNVMDKMYDFEKIGKFIDNSNDVFEEDKPFKVNEKDEISLDSVIFSKDFENAYQGLEGIQNTLSELTATQTTSPDVPTEDLLKKEKVDYKQKGGNNESKILNGKPCIVLFYADWCGWSQKMLPEWEKFKTDKNKEGKLKDLNVISVNDSNVAKSFGINQFPIIKFLKDGKEPATFSGERKSENFVKFAMENI
jgi:thiol-disulfide isomerase/thioredoxin